MRLIAVRAGADTLDDVLGRCWLAGATGIWEHDLGAGVVEVRATVAESDAAAFCHALAADDPKDITDETAVELATRTVHIGVAGEVVSLTVPPTVFGDGRHPTTADCLAIIERIVVPDDRILDVGCGSGVLSVAAASMGATVTALDIAADARTATEQNAHANKVAVRVLSFALGDVGGQYDLVVANLSPATLIELATDLVDHVGRGGRLLVSGIPDARWPEVDSALGRRLERIHVHHGWTTALLGAAPAESVP